MSTKIPIVGEVSREVAQLGDVYPSVLDETTFQTLRGTGWVLMDGRSIVGSSLHALTGASNVPDMRGRYPRMKDHGAGVNPDGDLAIGAAQADQFGTHNHGGGDHNHTSNYSYWNSGSAISGVGLDRTSYESPGARTALAPNVTGTHTSNNTSGAVIASNGGNETRPKSITLNFYVKIN